MSENEFRNNLLKKNQNHLVRLRIGLINVEMDGKWNVGQDSMTWW